MKHFTLKVLLLCLFALPAAAAQTPLQFTIVDGKTNKSILQITPTQKAVNNDGISVQKTYSPAKGSKPESWGFTLKNNSSDDRSLYLNWQVAWDKTTALNNLHYWGGRDDVISGQALLQNPSVYEAMTTTMLQTIYDNQSGLALAVPPMQIVSALKQSLKTENKKYFLHLQIPLVLSAGQSDTFPIEISHFTPRYGYRDALQKYFSAHPAAFNARKDIDPRAAGVGGSRPWSDLVTEGLDNIDTKGLLKASEKVRRFGTDWEWFYAPFRRTGDIYTRDKFWDYKPVKPFNYFRNQPSAEKFREFRHHLLESVDKAGATPAFYVPSFLYSDIELAKEQYPDAIIYKPDGSYARYYTTPWVIGNDNEVAMYPWGNKFAEQSMKDAKQVVAENPVHAFAYDIMAGEFRFRGKGMKESPRRAFDKDGEYVDTSVAVAKMADFTRSLEKNDKKVGLVGNITSDSRAFLVARSDTLMCEQAPYFYGAHIYAQDGSLISLRNAAGHKNITFWSGWRLPKLLKIDDMTPEQIRAAYQGAADFVRLSCYRFGAYPSIRASAGVPQMVRMLPLLKEVISEGWQAVPAVRGSDKQLPSFIWPTRYGNDIGSFITLGNAQKVAWSGKIIIDNDYVGDSNYLFNADDGGKVLSQIVQGRTTILEVQIPSHETLVLRAVAAVPTYASGAATVSWNDDGSVGALNIKSTFTPTKVLSPRDGWQFALRDGEKWKFHSLYFSSPLKEILDFAFFNDTSAAQILIPNPTAKELKDIKRLQEYFTFWGKQGLTPARDIKITVAKDSTGSSSEAPVIFLNAPKTYREGNALYVGNVTQLLNALDQKYFYTGELPTKGRDAESLKKADFPNNILQ